MPLPRQIGAYPLEKEILDIVIYRREDMNYEMSSEKEAHYFRHRLNRFRALARDEGRSTYDGLRFSIIKNVVRIEHIKPAGFLKNDKGEEVPVVIPPPKEEMAVAALVNKVDQWLDQVDLSVLEEKRDADK